MTRLTIAFEFAHPSERDSVAQHLAALGWENERVDERELTVALCPTNRKSLLRQAAELMTDTQVHYA